MFMYENIHRYRQKWNKTSNGIFFSIVFACTANSLYCDIKKIQIPQQKIAIILQILTEKKLIMNQSKFD